MSDIDFGAFRDAALARRLIDSIHAMAGDRQINLMEVCGTHTVSIGRYGFRSIMPAGVHLLSGPGCPVCVTSNRDIDHAIALSRLDGVVIATFGDMMRVPGSTTSLSRQKAAGRDVRIVYSPLDAVELAQANPHLQVIFMGVGFETTAPAIAATILDAYDRGIENFSVFCAHKTTPPALRAIASDPQTRIDGFILPGHVSTIDVLEGIAMLVRMVAEGAPDIQNAYRRGVDQGGNAVARQLVQQVFEPVDATWRGLGTIPASGLRIRDEFAHLDASRRFDVDIEPTREAAGCRCGDVLRGVITPGGCPLFGRACTPEKPVGPCMVSSEGSCAAYYRYREA